MKKVLSFVMALVICMCSANFVFAAASPGETSKPGDIEIDIGNNPGSGGGSAVGSQGNPLVVTMNEGIRVAAGGTYHIVVKNKAGWKITVSGAAGFKVNNTADNQGVYTAIVANENDAYTITNTTDTRQHYTIALVQYTSGDCTGDGYVNNEDVIYLLWHTLFEDDYPLSCSGDVNGDGYVNNEDVIYLLWHTLFEDDYPLKN